MQICCGSEERRHRQSLQFTQTVLGLYRQREAHKQYEYRNKVGIIATGRKDRKIITAIKAFLGNLYDEDTIEPLHGLMEDNKLKLSEESTNDPAGKGIREIKGVKVITPGKPKKSDSKY